MTVLVILLFKGLTMQLIRYFYAKMLDFTRNKQVKVIMENLLINKFKNLENNSQD